MNTQSQSENTSTEVKAEVVSNEEETSLVDTLFDIGLAWAEFGVSQGRKALETSAKTLSKAAESLSDLQDRLRKDERVA